MSLRRNQLCSVYFSVWMSISENHEQYVNDHVKMMNKLITRLTSAIKSHSLSILNEVALKLGFRGFQASAKRWTASLLKFYFRLSSLSCLQRQSNGKSTFYFAFKAGLQNMKNFFDLRIKRRSLKARSMHRNQRHSKFMGISKTRRHPGISSLAGQFWYFSNLLRYF